jgi:hypothetical protein
MVLNWHNDRSGCMYTSKSLEGKPQHTHTHTHTPTTTTAAAATTATTAAAAATARTCRLRGGLGHSAEHLESTWRERRAGDEGEKWAHTPTAVAAATARRLRGGDLVPSAEYVERRRGTPERERERERGRGRGRDEGEKWSRRRTHQRKHGPVPLSLCLGVSARVCVAVRREHTSGRLPLALSLCLCLCLRVSVCLLCSGVLSGHGAMQRHVAAHIARG